MRWLTADIVFDGYQFHEDYYIQVDEVGRILQINKKKPKQSVDKYQGLLMPGMVNAHCHLELSHTKGSIDEKIGLSSFLQEVSERLPQDNNIDYLTAAMKKADAEMLANGIVAVGDICNTLTSIQTKLASNIRYHNFVECISVRATDVKNRFLKYTQVYDSFLENFDASLGLHTPYTCHENLYKLVNQHSDFITIHNQESQAENLLFNRELGSFDKFYEHFGLDKNEIVQSHTASSSFENSQRLLGTDKKKLFVHNTFTTAGDLKFADKNTWFCFCPKANVYIEDQLPDITLFHDFQDQIVLGTDSLASNDSLNILSEVKTIQDNFPSISLSKILQWATSNGAKLFGQERELGSLDSLFPSLVHVPNFDLHKKRILSSELSVI